MSSAAAFVIRLLAFAAYHILQSLCFRTAPCPTAYTFWERLRKKALQMHQIFGVVKGFGANEGIELLL